jgi:hypothetical protein
LSPEALERLACDYSYFTSRFILDRPDQRPAGQKLSSYVSAMLRASPVACAALAAVGVLWKQSSQSMNQKKPSTSISRALLTEIDNPGEAAEEDDDMERDDSVGPNTAEMLYEEASRRLGDVLTEGKTPLTAKLASILDIG